MFNSKTLTNGPFTEDQISCFFSAFITEKSPVIERFIVDKYSSYILDRNTFIDLQYYKGGISTEEYLDLKSETLCIEYKICLFYHDILYNLNLLSKEILFLDKIKFSCYINGEKTSCIFPSPLLSSKGVIYTNLPLREEFGIFLKNYLSEYKYSL